MSKHSAINSRGLVTSENGVDVPLVQVFNVQSFDGSAPMTAKVCIETQFDKVTKKDVVYWTDVQDMRDVWCVYGDALYLRKTSGKVIDFLKDSQGEELVPLRVEYREEPMEIIVHKADLDHSHLRLSDAPRVEPQRKMSTQTRIQRRLYNALLKPLPTQIMSSGWTDPGSISSKTTTDTPNLRPTSSVPPKSQQLHHSLSPVSQRVAPLDYINAGRVCETECGVLYEEHFINFV